MTIVYIERCVYKLQPQSKTKMPYTIDPDSEKPDTYTDLVQVVLFPCFICDINSDRLERLESGEIVLANLCFIFKMLGTLE